MAAKKSSPGSSSTPETGFTAAEKAAMKEAVRERRARARGSGDGETDVRAKIAEMGPADRAIAERLHALIKTHAPALVPRTWYGMPAYSKDDEVVCFFQPAEKFGTRYATLGFSDESKLDEGHMWPVTFALESLGPAEESRVVALLKQALG